MYIDTHCHLSKSYYDDISSVISENMKAGVEKMIISGCDLEGIIEGCEFAGKYPEVYLTIGYHPEEADHIKDSDLEELEQLLKKNSKIVGIGEIGLDYHYGKENRDCQIRLFERQLKIAEKYQLPVVIHSRDAVFDTISTLKKFQVKGVIHCFSGSLETACEYIRMGFKLGIGGVVTFKNSKLADVLQKIDLQSIVLETDSPYLTPEPYRGKVNSSKYLPFIAEKLSNIYGISTEDVGNITTRNAQNMFSFPKV